MSRRSPGPAFLVIWMLCAGFSVTAARGDARLPGQPAVPAAGWHTDNEWLVTGNYAEACTDPPLCPGLFGAAPCGGPCRKLMIFQFLSGRYHNTNLTGLTAVAAVESPAEAAITPASRAAWPRCDLLISDIADSAEAYGIRMTLGAMLLGAGGPGFTRVETVPLTVLFSGARVTAESPGRLLVQVRPGASLNKVVAPDLNNLGSTFPFLGSLYIYQTDTLYYAGAGSPGDAAVAAAAAARPGPAARVAARVKAAAEAQAAAVSGAAGAPWNAVKRSGVVSQFTWTSQVAYEEAASPGKP